MRTFLLLLVACTFLPGNAQAVVRYWHLGAQTGTDTTDWNDPDNWGEAGSNLPGVPGSTDHVILNNFPPLTDPFIQGAAAPTVSILTPSWHDGVTSTLNIGPGGSINTSGFARLSAGDNAVSTVNFLPGAGVSVWPISIPPMPTARASSVSSIRPRRAVVTPMFPPMPAAARARLWSTRTIRASRKSLVRSRWNGRRKILAADRTTRSPGAT